MSTRKLMTIAAAAAVFMTAGMAWATEFRSKQTGDWSAYTSWQRLKAGSWADLAPTDAVPTSGDIAHILNGHTITVDGTGVQITTLDVQSGAIVAIPSAKDLSVRGSSTPTATITGTLDIQGGTFYVTNAGGASATATVPAGGKIEFSTTSGGVLNCNNSSDQVVLSSATSEVLVLVNGSLTGSGVMVGQNNAASLQIGPNSGSGSVTFTNSAVINGQMVIKRNASNGSAVPTFANQGVVDASASGELKLDSTLSAITDNLGSSCSTYRWRASGATLRFGGAFSGLQGDFDVAATLTCDGNVSTSGKLHGSGTINGAGTFTHSGGTCP